MKWIYSLLRCYVIFVVCGMFCISAYHAINCWCNNLDAWHELFYTERGFGIGVSVLFICFIMGPINVVFITFLHSIKINRFILNNNWNILIESLLYFFIYWLLFLRLYNPKEIGGWYLRWEFLTLYHYMLLFLLLSLHGWCMRKGISSRGSSDPNDSSRLNSNGAFINRDLFTNNKLLEMLRNVHYYKTSSQEE